MKRYAIALAVALLVLAAVLAVLPRFTSQAQTSTGQMHQRHPAAADVIAIGQTASIGTTNIVSTAPSGVYNVCWIQQITRAATISSSLQTTIAWNNGAAKSTTLMSSNGGALQLLGDLTNTANSTGSGCVMLFSAAGQPISYSTAYASVGATTMEYAFYVTAERYQ